MYFPKTILAALLASTAMAQEVINYGSLAALGSEVSNGCNNIESTIVHILSTYQTFRSTSSGSVVDALSGPFGDFESAGGQIQAACEAIRNSVSSSDSQYEQDDQIAAQIWPSGSPFQA